MKKKSFIVVMVIMSMLALSVFASGIKYGGTLTLTGGAASPSPARIFNPFSPSVLYGAYAIYQPLLNVNSFNGNITPLLATSFKWENDGYKLVYQLRRGANWSDGIPFTSKDVVYTFNMLKKYPALDTSGIWSTGALSSVVADGKYTVVFSFKKLDTPLAISIDAIPIVPEHIWSKIKNPVTWTDPNPIGTGPFVFERFAGSTYFLKRNPNYWQKGRPYIEQLKFVIYTTNTAATMALSRGILDWGGYFIPSIEKIYVSRNPKYYHYWFPPLSVIGLFFNDQKYPFNNLQVRRAIAMAINKEQISKIGEYGYGLPADPTGLLPSFMKKWFYTPLESLKYKYDPKEAKKLLEEAGFKMGKDGIFVGKNGKKLIVNLSVVTGWTDWVTDVRLISQDLKKIGILVNIKSTTFSTYMASLSTGSFDMALMWTGSGPSPYFTFKARMSSKNSAPIGKSAPANYERWEDPITNSALQIYRESTSLFLKKRTMAILEWVMLTQVPFAPLYYGPVWYEYNTTHFVGWPTKENPYCVPTNGYGSFSIILTRVHLR